jgi:2-iminobutanoate/2-iminopropanoate deaminase
MPMGRKVLKPKETWDSSQYSYSQGISVDSPKKLVFVAGQVSLDKEGKLVGKDDVVAQTEQAFRNVRAVLREGGCDLEDVVKLTVYVKRQEDFFKVTEARKNILGKNFPASTLVQVTSLAYPDLLVEVEATAAK